MGSTELIASVDKRVEFWTEAFDVATGGISTRVLDQGSFNGNIKRFNSYGMEFCKVEARGLAMVRSNSDIYDVEGKYLFFIYQNTGNSVHQQREKETTLRPGDMILLDSAQPFQIDYNESAHVFCFHLPRGQALHKWRYAQLKLAEKVSADSSLATLVTPLLRETVRIASTAPIQSDGDHLLNATLNLLTPLFTKECDKASQYQSIYLQRAMAYIDQNLCNENITSIMIAKHVGVSPRHLQRLFKSLGTSASKLILEKRICACANDLIDVRCANVDVTTIAFYWGFKDTSYFSRVFKDYYGVPPSQYRGRFTKRAI